MGRRRKLLGAVLSRAAPDQVKQQSRPGEVGRPRVRVDEDLDHCRHSEQRERRQPREKTEHEQDREDVLGVGREVRGDLGGG